MAETLRILDLTGACFWSVFMAGGDEIKIEVKEVPIAKPE